MEKFIRENKGWLVCLAAMVMAVLALLMYAALTAPGEPMPGPIKVAVLLVGAAGAFATGLLVSISAKRYGSMLAMIAAAVLEFLAVAALGFYLLREIWLHFSGS